MSKYLKHIPCSNCGSSDARAVYSDGGEYCFSCGFYKSGNSLNVIRKIQNQQDSSEVSHSVCKQLPSDTNQNYSDLALAWTKKYALGVNELLIQHNKVYYSDQRQQLIFTFHDESGNILVWQARNLGDVDKKNRYFTSGDINNLLPIYSNCSGNVDGVVVVEDCLSAMKVSLLNQKLLNGFRAHAMPLLGSDISNLKLSRLKRFYDVLWVFLDPNMYHKAQGIAKRAQALGFKTHVIQSDRDPKEHSYEQLQELLTK